MYKTDQMFKIEILLREPLKEFLERKYTQEGLSLRQISQEIEKRTGRKFNKCVLSLYLKNTGIPARQSMLGNLQKLRKGAI